MFQTNVAEEIKRHILCSETFSLENRAVYDMWKNTVQQDRPQMIVWRMHIACWIPRDTNTHIEYAKILLFHCNNGYANALQCYVSTHLA